MFLDTANTRRAVTACTGQNNRHSALLLVLGQGAQEKVDRQAHPAPLCRLCQIQRPVLNAQKSFRRYDIDVVRCDLCLIGR